MATPVLQTSMATHYSSQVTALSLHTGDPGTTGANEVAGGAPAYARKAPVWTINGVNADAAALTFDAPAVTITHVGMWNASGQFLDSVPHSVALTAQGTVVVTLHYNYGSVTVGG